MKGVSIMRRSASEIIRNLETRVARLEKRSYPEDEEGNPEDDGYPYDYGDLNEQRKYLLSYARGVDIEIQKTFPKQMMKALKSKGATNIKVHNFHMNSSDMNIGTMYNEKISQSILGGGDVSFMIKGIKYEIDFWLELDAEDFGKGSNICLCMESKIRQLRDTLGRVKSTRKGLVSEVILSEYFTPAIAEYRKN
jgi:hypothetical protein